MIYSQSFHRLINRKKYTLYVKRIFITYGFSQRVVEWFGHITQIHHTNIGNKTSKYIYSKYVNIQNNINVAIKKSKNEEKQN